MSTQAVLTLGIHVGLDGGAILLAKFGRVTEVGLADCVKHYQYSFDV